jgi:hypothetical protein
MNVLLTVQGIPGIPDLTQPQQLLQFGSQALSLALLLTVVIGGFGVVIALFNFSLRRDVPEQVLLLNTWIVRYSRLLTVLQHLALVLIILISSFFVCSTLANRYHGWEQGRVTQIASAVSGQRLEQLSPQVRYFAKEPYTFTRIVEGQPILIEETRDVSRSLKLAGSQVQVKLDQIQDPQNQRAIYKIDFNGEYQVTNRLTDTSSFFFDIAPPSGYTLLENFKVEQNKTRLQSFRPGNNEFSFPFELPSGEKTSFRVTYQAQGSPRWVYNADGQLLSNFRLSAQTNFPGADFASGIVPTERKAQGDGTVFTWVFNDNVSVLNPFGVFTATSPIRNTGILPRLLLLAPGIFLWWLLLLYLAIPFNLKQVAIAAGMFFATILALTYFSRIADARQVWAGLSILLLVLSWSLGISIGPRSAIAAILCTVAGVAIPILGLLIPYTGLTLSLAAILSAIWVVVCNWTKRREVVVPPNPDLPQLPAS